jgi:hypothetical protein
MRNMSDAKANNISGALDEIGDAVMTALAYGPLPPEKIDSIINTIDAIASNPSSLKQCEDYLKAAGGNYFLFFLSNILYNLKRKEELVLTDDVMKWFCSVWKNFLKRDKAYQQHYPAFNEYRTKIKKYYPLGPNFISQIENVNLIRDDFLTNPASEEGPLLSLEKFYLANSGILTVMKPTYFFLLDYYYEKKISTGEDTPEAVGIEAGGLEKFGQTNYTYREIAVVTCQALGILEAAYLILKKKKTQRRLVNVDGRQKFLTAPDIYNLYLEKFNAMKKELINLGR